MLHVPWVSILFIFYPCDALLKEISHCWLDQWMTENTVQWIKIAHGNTIVKGRAYGIFFAIEMPFFMYTFSTIILFPRICIQDLTFTFLLSVSKIFLWKKILYLYYTEVKFFLTLSEDPWNLALFSTLSNPLFLPSSGQTFHPVSR